MVYAALTLAALTLNVQSGSGLAHRSVKKLSAHVKDGLSEHMDCKHSPFDTLTSVRKADIFPSKEVGSAWELLCLEPRPSLSASYWPSGKRVTRNLCAA